MYPNIHITKLLLMSLEEKVLFFDTSIIRRIKIYFKVHKKVKFGEGIFIIGNNKIFDNWNLNKAKRLNYGE